MLYYKTDFYQDGSLAIMTWTDDDGYLEPYGDVTVNLSGYGMMPPKGCIFMPKYKMNFGGYFDRVVEDIVDEIVGVVPIGYGDGVIARLKENWQEGVKVLE